MFIRLNTIYSYEEYANDKRVNQAANPFLSKEKTMELLDSDEGDLKWELATHTSHPEVLARIAKEVTEENDYIMLSLVSMNSATSLETLRYLCSKHMDHKIHVANNTNIDYNLAKELYLSDDDEVTRNLAMNPATPQDILYDLYALAQKDIVTNLKTHLAFNPMLSESMLLELAKTASTVKNLLMNESINEYLLSKIEKMHGLAVMGYGTKSETLPSSFFYKYSDYLFDRKGLVPVNSFSDMAGNRATPLDLLEKIYRAFNDNNILKAQMSRNPSTPNHILKELASDFKFYPAVIANPSATSDMLQKNESGEYYGDMKHLMEAGKLNADFIELNVKRAEKNTDHTLLLACRSPLAQMEDVLKVLESNATLAPHILYFLLDEEEHAFHRFDEFLKNKFDLDVDGLPPIMVADLLGIPTQYFG
jgi:hypothetical protein